MCTAVAWGKNNRYFGRNLDYERRFEERVVISPRNFPFVYRRMDTVKSHYAIIGMASVRDGYPLYYDGMNEHGLCMAGLNFVGNASFFEPSEELCNVAQFELLPWILGGCRDVCEAREFISRLNLTSDRFSPDTPPAELHWMISDKNECIVLEIRADGVHVFENEVKVLTNNPPFEFHTENLSLYLGLSTDEPINSFSNKIDLEISSRGMGALGLPGDASSTSRFVRAAFVSSNAIERGDGTDIEQFFHILSAVEQVEGCVAVGDGYEKTQYSSCSDTVSGIYYYRTYENSRTVAVSMKKEDILGERLIFHDVIWRSHASWGVTRLAQ